MRVLQDSSEKGLRDAQLVFESQLRLQVKSQTVAAQYGLAFIALKQQAYDKAERLLKAATAAAAAARPSLALTDLGIDIKLAANQSGVALTLATAALDQFRYRAAWRTNMPMRSSPTSN